MKSWSMIFTYFPYFILCINDVAASNNACRQFLVWFLHNREPLAYFIQKTSVTKKTHATQDKDVPHNMGKSDLIRASDFNFLMVLGKGSFGKVCNLDNLEKRGCIFRTVASRWNRLIPGLAGGEKGYR